MQFVVEKRIALTERNGANANGQGVAASLLLRIQADGSLSYETIAQFDVADGRFAPAAINLSPADDQLFLLLFGSGIRDVSDLSAVSCNIGEQDAPVLFAGRLGNFARLDQVNVALPRSPAGRGLVNLSCASQASPPTSRRSMCINRVKIT
jgi:uncharacterized protein (TIGR03437 family)